MSGKRVLTWFLAGLLTLCLTGCVLCFIAVRNMTSLSLYERIAVNDTVMSLQMARAEGKIEELAQEYHFPAELATDLVTLDAFAEKNREAAVWWTDLMNTGRSGEVPTWKLPELRSALESNPTFLEGLQEDDITTTAMEATEDVEKVLTSTVLPMRSNLVQAGVGWVQRRVHVTSLVRFLSGVPGILLALVALLAGFIALLNVREPVRWLRLFGSVLGAAALSLLLVMIFTMFMNLGGMIQEASQVLAGQYGVLSGNTLLWMGAAILGLAGFSAVMLVAFARKTAGDQKGIEAA